MALGTVGSVALDIEGDASGLARNVESGMGSTIKRLAKLASGMFAGVAAGKFLKDSIMGASDLSESINAIRASLGKGAKSFLDFGTNAANALGITQAQLNAAVVPMAAMLSDAGSAGEVLSGQLQTMASRATDVGSVFNADVNTVLTAFGAAIRGEQEPIRQFGVSLSQASIAAQAVKMGLANSTTEVGQAAKIQATYALVLEKTSKFAGDFAATSDGLANRMKIAKANFSELQTTLGAELLPTVNNVLGGFVDLIQQFRNGEGPAGALKATLVTLGDYLRATFGPAIAEMRDRFIEAGPGLHDFFTALTEGGVNVLPAITHALKLAMDVAGLFAVALGKIGTFINDHTVVFGTVATMIATVGASMWLATAATTAWTVVTGGLVTAFWALNGALAAMSANPIGAIIVAIAALAAGFVYAWKHSETFRDIVTGAFNTIVSGVGIAIKSIVSFLGFLVDKWLWAFQVIAEGMSHVPILGGQFKGVVDAIQGVRDGVSGMVNDINAQIDRITKVVQIDVHVRTIQEMADAVDQADHGNAPLSGSAAVADSAKRAAAAAQAAIPKITPFTGGGGGGGDGGKAAKDAAEKAAKDAAKKVAAALKAATSQVTARKFVASITGEPEDIKTAFGKLIDNLKAANRPKVAAYAKTVRASLLDLAGDREALRATFRGVAYNIEELTDKVKDLRQESADFAAGVKAAIIDTGSVAEGPKGIGTTFTGIRNNLREAIKGTAAFAAAIATLQKLKLNRTSLSQLIAAGPEAGLAAAQAIARQGAKGVTDINDLQSKLSKAGGDLGSSVADTMFSAGIRAAEGLLEGLTSKEAAIDKAMTRIAKKMVDTIKNELGIHSRSKVGFAIGANVGLAMASGVDASRNAAADAGARIGRSMVTFAPGSVQVNGVSDPERARVAGILTGHGVADALARNRTLLAMAGG